jgi:hypothetical protein
VLNDETEGMSKIQEEMNPAMEISEAQPQTVKPDGGLSRVKDIDGDV